MRPDRAGAERQSVVIAGSLASRAGKGGSTWARLQWVLGFERLGWDVLFLDRLDADMCVDAAGRPCAPEVSVNVAYFRHVMDGFGLAGRSCLIYDGGSAYIGMDRADVLERVARSAFLINIMGFLRDPAVLETARFHVFLDIDPGFTQMWHDQGLTDVLDGYDAFVTIGENIGREECTTPTCGLQWITSPQPIVLEHWPVQLDAGKGWTSVVTWRGAYGPLSQDGITYGLRVHEFRRFASLPQRAPGTLELALDIHPSETKDLELLHTKGWRVTDPRTVAADPWRYADYVRTSRGELGIAKNMYVASQSGWFSDRSMCYLASGRPVVAQDTGFSRNYPTGEGLHAFTSPDDAADALRDVHADYPRHALAARKVAEEHFDSDRVLTRLVTQLGVPS